MGNLVEQLKSWGLDDTAALWANDSILGVALIILCIVADIIAKKYLVTGLVKITEKTKAKWDDKLVARGVFNRLAHIAPAIVAYWGVPVLFQALPQFSTISTKIILSYMVIVTASVLLAAIEAGNDIYREFPVSKDRPIKGYLQIVKLFIICVAIILVVTSILNVNPVGILSGLGAMSAVLILVFKDSLMGLVASISLAANNMVRIGDWIEMPKYGADGNVIDITLQTIQVQNWDKTITSIPIYSLISDSFKNWRGMSEGGGRRIKRSLNIDMSSVSFLTHAELEQLKQKRLITDYLSHKESDIIEYREKNKGGVVPERRLTNVGTYRAYVKEYLASNSEISRSMTFLVRQLAPTPQGLPIEIYVFSTNKVWGDYEDIQADIFDHLISVLPEFGLRVFQDPTGADFRQLS